MRSKRGISIAGIVAGVTLVLLAAVIVVVAALTTWWVLFGLLLLMPPAMMVLGLMVVLLLSPKLRERFAGQGGCCVAACERMRAPRSKPSDEAPAAGDAVHAT